ncbi:MAG: hypothetical protein K2H29_12730 [Oscillospiraceae bacterium]|nr:hypothetical protein [Oscillospiraceae bacterium]
MIQKLLVGAVITVATTAVAGGIYLSRKKQYDDDGFNAFGYDKEGYNHQGYDRNGYDRDGFDRTGHNAGGYCKDGYNDAYIDISGFSREYYKIVCEEMQELLDKAVQCRESDKCSESDQAVRDFMQKGVRAVIAHWKGVSNYKQTLYMNLIFCEEQNLLNEDLTAILYDTDSICKRFQYDDVDCYYPDESYYEETVDFEAVSGLLGEVRKFT